VYAIYDKLNDSYVVNHTHAQKLVSELRALELEGFRTADGSFFFVKVRGIYIVASVQ
jgi:hypothetical protein